MSGPRTVSPPTPLLDAVRSQQVRQLYAHGFPMLATLVASALLSGLFVSMGVLAPWIAVTWVAVMASHITARLVMRGVYHRSAERDARWRVWANRFTAGALVAGVTLGLGAVAIMPAGRFDLQMLVIVTITAVVYATQSSFGSWSPAFAVFTLGTLVPSMVWTLAQGDAPHLVYFLLALIWTPSVIVLARRQEANLVRTLTLQFENAALAEDLRGQKLLAEQASVAKSRFLASASHDLRQPVHALGMLVGALRTHHLPERSVNLIDHLDTSIGALDSLFTSLLDISRLDAGVVESREAATLLDPLVARICRELEGPAAEKGLRLVHVRSGLAATSDPFHLERILRNLIGNAVRYTERGRVLVGCRRRGAAVVIEVWDTGPGIAPDQQEAVFEEFYQLGNPDRDRAKGLGLGLAIVRRLTAILGHELSLESRTGRGSVFRVRAARSDAADVEASVSPEAQLGPAVTGVILAIDDEAQIRVGMAELLRSWGHEVIVAGSGEEACAVMAGRPPPDLVICDYRLRDGETGVDAILRLQAVFERPAAAMLITGDTAAENIREALASGYPLLHKPLSHARLRAAVTSLLRQGQATKTGPAAA